jgi:hypothetical protein
MTADRLLGDQGEHKRYLGPTSEQQP